ncbi:hypothetical protein KM176_05635 [Pseudooceanicola sp. CBS1P-1]|uniref:Phage tail assembly protein n=1 Tax=Pseudooceanicola albus TaxID=2692189 RepID=A0A6L7G199_9RHOB|nr:MULTISPECIES: hypothetical protein [Pseudooceanicola]MBT9383334.1 hypothetical protein [Pseudooceanicola endophyticus]MXN16343.1 hypothetical protein [Pseudooceanicola albus]
MKFPVRVPLKTPIKDADTDAEITALVFEEPDIGLSIEVEDAETPRDQMFILLAGMAGIGIPTFKRLKESDYRAVIKQVLDPYNALQVARAAEDGVGNAGEAAT